MSASNQFMCGAEGCGNPGKFQCSRCKVSSIDDVLIRSFFHLTYFAVVQTERYCSPDCQKRSWQQHKTVCEGKVEEPYTFDYDIDRTKTSKLWLASEMKKAPDQSVDPPPEYDFNLTWWR
jgi:hypothetical protein